MNYFILLFWYHISFQLKDARPKSDNGQTNNDNGLDMVNSQSNPSSSQSSNRKRTFSSEAKKDDDLATENNSTNKQTASSDKSNEIVDDPKSPESKKSRLEDSPTPGCQIDNNSEDSTGKTMSIAVTFAFGKAISVIFYKKRMIN